MAFKKMEDEGILPGPRGIMITGFDGEDLLKLGTHLLSLGIENLPLRACREDQMEGTVAALLEGGSDSPLVGALKLPPVIILSGIRHEELDTFLGSFADTGLKRPIFATSTEHNLKFTVKELLRHLMAEQKGMREAMKKK